MLAFEQDKVVIGPYSVMISNLGKNMTKQDLQGIMGKFGQVRNVEIPVDEFKQNKGYGYVVFTSV